MLVDLSRPIWKPSLSSCAILPLYVKSPSYAGVGPADLTLGAHSFADFMTYFGSFSVKKWRRYTGIHDLTPTLVLETSTPVSVTLTKMVYRRLEKRAIREITQPTERTADDWYRYVIAYPEGIDAQLVAFTVVAGAEPATIRNVRYCADLQPARDVRIEIITTTYHKEQQVTGNIAMIRRELLEDPQWGQHFRLTVVDNGRTLPSDLAAGEESITLIPNGNVGGAGGFAAGMLHAAESGWATHVLLMDDDVTVCPESFKRTVRLLQYADDEYANATVAGAMLSTANFEMQQEDIGRIQPERNLQPFKPRLIMDREYDICFNEELIPSSDTKGLYSAWWYSCFPVQRVRDYGLPIPLFYRRDDVEYATRIQEKEPLKFITLNGVCVWHDAFDLRWNPAVEVYLSTRNMLIQQAFTPDAGYSMQAMVDLMRDAVVKHGRRFDYPSMELVCDAIEDYLRGPDFYRHPVGERLFKQAAAKAEKVMPLSEIPGAPDSVDIFTQELEANDENVVIRPELEPPAPQPEPEPAPEPHHSVIYRGLRKVYHILRPVKQPVSVPQPQPVEPPRKPVYTDMAIIPIDGWCRPWRVVRYAGKALAVDTTGQRGVMRVRDDERGEQLIARFDGLARTLLDDTAVREAYRESRASMTSFEFWHEYLREARQ